MLTKLESSVIYICTDLAYWEYLCWYLVFRIKYAQWYFTKLTPRGIPQFQRFHKIYCWIFMIFVYLVSALYIFKLQQIYGIDFELSLRSRYPASAIINHISFEMRRKLFSQVQKLRENFSHHWWICKDL